MLKATKERGNFMKKKIFSLLIIAVMLLSSLFIFAGCGDEDEAETKSSKKNKTSTSQKNKDEDEEEEDEENKTSKNKADKDEDEEEENKSNNTISNKNPTASANLGDKYVDLNNRSFAVNGKVYTLGVTTLQQMIDDGVPFEEDDMANAGNNVNKNAESQSFHIELGEYYTATVRTANFTDGNMKASECPISYIYLPVIKDQQQNILQFAFPLTVTEEEFVANAGEPTDKSEYGDSRTYRYKVDSTKYYGSSGYNIEFNKGELRYITIDYKP